MAILSNLKPTIYKAAMTIAKKVAPDLPTALTQAMLEAKVTRVEYYAVPDSTTTICFLYLENGFIVDGKSGCVNPANYNLEAGKRYAYDNAIDKMWDLEGYLLKNQRYEANK